MLELILEGKALPLNLQNGDYGVTRRLSGVNTLEAVLPAQDPVALILREELLIRETWENRLYRIKGIQIQGDTAEFSARLRLDDWEATAVTYFHSKNASISAALGKILPAGWTVNDAALNSNLADITMEYGGTPLDIALAIQEVYGCAMDFDPEDRVLTVTYPHAGALTDTVLTQGADLREIPSYTGKSTDLVTRVYPVGANGLTIEKVNNGKAFVENHSYTDRVIAKVWKDERYEIPEHLRDAAQAMVDALAVPETAWEIRIYDLYRRDPGKWQGHRAVLGEKVTVSWGGRKLSALVVEEVVHPGRPEENTLCIGSVPATAIGALGQLKETISDPNSSFNSEREAAIANATKLISGSRGGHVVTVLDEDGKPEELCILSDSEDISTAQSLWRWNEGGLGHSDTGYNGPFTLALTKDGAIVADRITVGTLNAGVLKAGILTDGQGKNQWNLETGEFSLSAASTVGGSTVGSIADSAAASAAASAVSGYDSGLDQQKIFNRLTGGGQTQGIYLSGGLLYINGSYVKAGILTDGQGKNQWNLNTGEFALSSSATVGGSTVGSIAASAASSAVSEYDSGLDQQKIFNRLTGGGQTQGIYLTDGRVYINGSYIKTGTLDANTISMSGKLLTKNGDSTTNSGYMGYMEGATAAGKTSGIGISNQAGDCYFIATSAGARMQTGSYGMHMTKAGAFQVDSCGGQLILSTGESMGPGLYITGKIYQRDSANDQTWRQL